MLKNIAMVSATIAHPTASCHQPQYVVQQQAIAMLMSIARATVLHVLPTHSRIEQLYVVLPVVIVMLLRLAQDHQLIALVMSN